MPAAEHTDGIPLRFEGFTIDASRGGLYRGDERLHLTPTPLKALEFLVRNHGRVVSKEQLLSAVWGEQRGENTVEQAVRQIRRALGDDREQPRFIQTVPGEGYRFIATAREADAVSSSPAPKFLAGWIDVAQTAGRKPRVAVIWLSGTAALVACSVGLALFLQHQMASVLTATNPVRITRSHTHILSPLLSAGSQILYPRYENGQYNVASVPAEGGESVAVPTRLANPELCDITPDGRAMLLRNLIHSRDDLEPLYVETMGGAAQRVGDIWAYDAAWYPDAKRILYSANGIVYTTDLEGKSREQLFSAPGNAFWFRWAPGGQRLRFTVIDKRSEETSLWEVSSKGENPHAVFPELHEQSCCGSWAPDGTLYFFQVRMGSAFQIWAQRDRHRSLWPVRSQPFPLIFGAESYRAPLAGTDARKLFVRAEAPHGELVRYDSQIGKFIPILPSISVRTAAFSMNGNWVAYTSLADNNLWRCRADGMQCLQLTHDFKNTVMPRWSPDGESIAFMGIGYTGDWGVFSVPARGGSIHTLSHGNSAKGYPDWSAAGDALAFSDVPPVSQPGGIYLLDMRTNKIAAMPESTDYFFPRWSPDGHFLLALHAGNLYLYLRDLKSGRWRPLTDVPASYPVWSRDSRYVYFRPYDAKDPAIFRVEVQTGRLEKIANLAAVERGAFFMGDWIGLAPDGSPLAINNATTEDIYGWDLIKK